MNPKLNAKLKALLLGGTVAFSLEQTASAASTELPKPEKINALEARVEKIRQQLENDQSNDSFTFKTGSGPQGNADLMWWRNAWGNGGWHNWHNGWGNWHNW